MYIYNSYYCIPFSLSTKNAQDKDEHNTKQ